MTKLGRPWNRFGTRADALNEVFGGTWILLIKRTEFWYTCKCRCSGAIRAPALVNYFATVPGVQENTEAVYAVRRLGEPEEIAMRLVSC